MTHLAAATPNLTYDCDTHQPWQTDEVIEGGKLPIVNGAVALARGFGVSETVIGLTIVAVGTSMPELVTSVIAALKRQVCVHGPQKP